MLGLGAAEEHLVLGDGGRVGQGVVAEHVGGAQVGVLRGVQELEQVLGQVEAEGVLLEQGRRRDGQLYHLLG